MTAVIGKMLGVAEQRFRRLDTPSSYPTAAGVAYLNGEHVKQGNEKAAAAALRDERMLTKLRR